MKHKYFVYRYYILFFRFHLLILYTVHSEKAEAFSFCFFYTFHCGLHSAVHGEKADAFFFLINFFI